MTFTAITERELHKEYLRLVKTCHPDLHPNDPKAEDRFKQLQLEYQRCKKMLVACKPTKKGSPVNSKSKRRWTMHISIPLTDSIYGKTVSVDIRGLKYPTTIFRIPAGVTDGQILEYSTTENKFVVTVNIVYPQNYYVKDKKLYYKIEISFLRWFFGTSVQFINVFGSPGGLLEIVPRISLTSVWTLAGEGLFNPEKKERAPLYIDIKLTII